jgi:hypothetical protein
LAPGGVLEHAPPEGRTFGVLELPDREFHIERVAGAVRLS